MANNLTFRMTPQSTMTKHNKSQSTKGMEPTIHDCKANAAHWLKNIVALTITHNYVAILNDYSLTLLFFVSSTNLCD